MKHKKFISMLLVFALMLVLSQSAFALPGMGDTQEKAINIEPGVRLNSALQDSTDYDWYKWENKTGKNKYTIFQVVTPSEDSGVLLGAVVIYPLGHQTLPFYADPSIRRHQNLWNILVPPYAKIYFFLKNTGDKLEPYEIRNFGLIHERPGDEK
ncbi:hypothetical protein M3650_02330 [Paenibacillus sp. MER TA 81-3]|uniref:hypothetical protein n=1 Tax=Paenibacillus sp. MER TA 81-3 TaxID=2939573 RepID=UPI00203F1132|nr:hypothetical protein [Paenibacillus sp. MER TA 81-3]MCM3337512.1 hypothetical protein [Paenibacillus sp. MER TA 81-3]